jgi:membrane protease YdiL (CAAX protease family)
MIAGWIIGAVWPVRGGLVWSVSAGTATWIIAVWAASYVMLRLVDRRPWSSIGLGRAQAAPRLLAAGFGLGALGILVPSGVLLLSHELSIGVPAHPGGTWAANALALAAVLLPAALMEEMLSRGYIVSAIRESIGPVWAVLITSAGFAALHLGNPGVELRDIALVALAGVWLSTIVVLTGSLWAATAAHFAWNWAMGAVLHSPISGIALPLSDYTTVSTGPDWLTGGAWGPEGGVAAALGMVAGIVAVAAWRRRMVPAPEFANG